MHSDRITSLATWGELRVPPEFPVGFRVQRSLTLRVGHRGTPGEGAHRRSGEGR